MIVLFRTSYNFSIGFRNLNVNLGNSSNRYLSRKPNDYFFDNEKTDKKVEEENVSIFDDESKEVGMDLVYRRAFNILEAVTERKMTKLLQV